MDQLQQARQIIDRADREMARLFEQRMQAVRQVIEYKRSHDLPILDAAREEQVVAKNMALLTDAELAPYYEEYIRRQMELSRRYQAHILGRETIAYQGVEGAFSHIALTRLFPGARAKSCAGWDEVFTAVETQQAAFGVLPFENSSAGDVSAVLDLCWKHDLYVVQMYDLPVGQNLLGLPGASLGDIRTVYSHPQAISQSERFLKTLNLTAQPMENTAAAAQFVSQQGNKALAAIASEETAALYGLQVLASQINTEGDNTTRFIVVGREKPTQGNRFSLLFAADHKAGMLAQVIQQIGAAGFNMECIKSRPMPHVQFEYYFYVELVGDANSPAAQQLLAEMQATCRTVRLLGVYSR